MKVSEFNFSLPSNLLARRPREISGQTRSDSRLLILHRQTGEIQHEHVRSIRKVLREGDLLVLNNSQTVNAVFKGRAAKGNFLEIALCSQLENGRWLAQIKGPHSGQMYEQNFVVSEELRFSVEAPSDRIKGLYEVSLAHSSDFSTISAKYGKPILSNYTERQWDLSYYQNEYASVPGSVELPAAGRHFTADLLDELRQSGVQIEFITLHTGLSSFTIETENLEEHVMYEEQFSICEKTAQKINETKQMGGRVIGVGTTVVRTLESAVDESGRVVSGTSSTDLYIYPGFQFQVLDGLVTNFHGPRTSRLVLAAAFACPEMIKKAYASAIEEGYLFYEFGDATLIL